MSSWLFCWNSCFFSSLILFPLLSSAPPLGVLSLFLFSAGCSDTTSIISSFSFTYEEKRQSYYLKSPVDVNKSSPSSRERRAVFCVKCLAGDVQLVRPWNPSNKIIIISRGHKSHFAYYNPVRKFCTGVLTSKTRFIKWNLIRNNGLCWWTSGSRFNAYLRVQFQSCFHCYNLLFTFSNGSGDILYGSLEGLTLKVE